MEEKENTNLLIKVPKGMRDLHPYQMIIRDKVFTTIKSIFSSYGAVCIETPTIERKDILTKKYGEDSKLIYDLADQGGEILALRYDLTVPFARYVASYNIANMKRYQIGRVYRMDEPNIGKGRYREFYQCDFDIAGFSNAPLMMTDAEVLKLANDILKKLNIGDFTIKINHRKLLDALMIIAGVPNDKLRTVCSTIDKLDKESWANLIKELQLKGLSNECISKLEKYVTAKSCKLSDAIILLENNDEIKNNDLGKQAITELKQLQQYIGKNNCYDCDENVIFEFSLARGLDYYTGIIYEAVLLEKGISIGSIAGGGRYDNLIGSFCGKTIPAVGVSIGIERVFTILEKQMLKECEEKKITIKDNTTQIFICSIGKAYENEKIKLVNKLREAGFSTDFAYDGNMKPRHQLAIALEKQVSYVIFIGETEIKGNSVTIKNINNGKQVSILQNKLIEFLKNPQF